MTDEFNPADVSLNLVETMTDVEAFRRWLGQRRDVLAFDTETGGLEWWKDPLRLVQFGDAETGWAMPWEDWAGVAKEVLRGYRGPMVAHNLNFDGKVLDVNGAPPPRNLCHDSMLLAHVLDSSRPVGLKPLSEALVHPDAGAGARLLKRAMKAQGWTWATVPTNFEPYWAYGALDPVLTARVWGKLTASARVQGGLRDAYELEVAAAWVVSEMERNGVHIDLEYVDRLGREKTLELLELEAQSLAWGVDKPGSYHKVLDRLRADGIVFTKPSKVGEKKLDQGIPLGQYDYAVDEDVLEPMSHPFAAVVLGYRRARKILTTYVRALDQRHVDAVLHPSVNPVGARTGRHSVTAPPLQTIPRGPVVRDCFTARSGNHLVLADYDQIEMRLLAHFADERSMQDAIWAGVDLHDFATRRIYGVPDSVSDQEVHDDPRRDVTKNANFAKAYVAGVATFSATAGIPVSDGEQFMAMYDAQFPGVRQFHRIVEQRALERHAHTGRAFVSDPLGRRHYAPVNKAYKLVNYLIQGTAAVVLKQALVNLDAAGLTPLMVLPVHDEVIFDVPAENAPEVAAEAARVMTDTTSFSVPLTVGTDVVYRWGDKYRKDRP